MFENYISFDYHAQNDNSDQTPLVAASLMNHPFTTSPSTRNTTNCSSSSSTSTTTHSIKNSSHNNDNVDYNNSNIETAAYKRSLINPALVKRKQYSKSVVVLYTSYEAMNYCDRASFGLAIASLSVVFYFIGAIFYIAKIVQLKANSQDTIILQTIFLIICLIMSIVSSLLIFGIVEQRHLLMVPWIILMFVAIVCDIIYLTIVLYTGSEKQRSIESIIYLFGIGLQSFILIKIYRLYKYMKWKFNIQHERIIMWRAQQELIEENC